MENHSTRKKVLEITRFDKSTEKLQYLKEVSEET